MTQTGIGHIIWTTHWLVDWRALCACALGISRPVAYTLCALHAPKGGTRALALTRPRVKCDEVKTQPTGILEHNQSINQSGRNIHESNSQNNSCSGCIFYIYKTCFIVHWFLYVFPLEAQTVWKKYQLW